MPAPTAKPTQEAFKSQYQYNITLDYLYKEFPRSYCNMRIKKSCLTILAPKKSPNNPKLQLTNTTDTAFKGKLILQTLNVELNKLQHSYHTNKQVVQFYYP